MTFPAYRLPEEIEVGAQGGPEFMTVIQEAVSGQEQRVRVWAKCRARYDIGYSVLNSEDPTGNYRAIVALFYGHFGRLRPFRFKDWGDFTADDTNFGSGDGSETEFQLSKTYDPSQILLNTPGTLTYTRDIYLLNGTPIIKVNNVTQSTPANYSISATGLVTFTSPPTNGHALTWSGEFDLPVRFDIDYLPVIMDEALLARFGGIALREVVGSAELA